jgi:hypothetical protein
MVTYDPESPHYAVLWNILSWSAHVINPRVTRRENRRMNAGSDSVPVIAQIATFKCAPAPAAGWFAWLYRMRLVHDRDEYGRPVIRMFCLTAKELRYFERLIQMQDVKPSFFELTDTSLR